MIRRPAGRTFPAGELPPTPWPPLSDDTGSRDVSAASGIGSLCLRQLRRKVILESIGRSGVYQPWPRIWEYSSLRAM